jgi:hypothetical protein
MRSLCTIALGLVAFAGLVVPAAAQELRVYTRTVDLTDPSKPVVARSLTLFHAGKVYDYVEAAREITVYDPAHRRFFVIEESLGEYAEVTLDEIRRFLELAEGRARELVADLIRQPSPAAPDAVDFLQVQLTPQFAARYDQAPKRLQLKSPKFLYEVACNPAPQPAVLNSYLKYADAIAELNAVLHPHSLLPGPRWQLNRELRQRGQPPTTVRRRLEFGSVSDLRAEHEWTWNLGPHDRQKISHWESLLSNQVLRPVSFKQLQQDVLGGGLAKK